jgi:hypothetical protein
MRKIHSRSAIISLYISAGPSRSSPSATATITLLPFGTDSTPQRFAISLVFFVIGSLNVPWMLGLDAPWPRYPQSSTSRRLGAIGAWWRAVGLIIIRPCLCLIWVSEREVRLLYGLLSSRKRNGSRSYRNGRSGFFKGLWMRML